MTHSTFSLWSFVAHADTVVKCVLLLLLITSITSWTLILQRFFFLKQRQNEINRFEGLFWSGNDLAQIYNKLAKKKDTLFGLTAIFYDGFSEFLRLNQTHAKGEFILSGTQRAMRVAQSRETAQIEQHLSFLATVGSTSPYIGLFGTVWGIMSSFRNLGGVEQATISMVAPGIAEALLATAIGLFAAIPAVIAYNRFANTSERLNQSYLTFQEELSTILNRKTNL